MTAILIEFGGLLVPQAGWVAAMMMLWVSPLWTRGGKFVVSSRPPAVGIVLPGVFAIGGSDLRTWRALVLGAIAGPVLAVLVTRIILSRRGWFRAG